MIDKKDVKYVANLAKIKIASGQEAFLEEQFSKIIGYIDKLKELNVEGVEPSRGAHITRDVFREDKVVPSDCREEILKNSPSREGDYFKIPKVVE
ncbi:MAG: Asp-tRNA(Asn)/Glu-tRNA(Gln) amidotransferase subunit GatC [Candidatus Omnitrophica bacterium]|nr:Asp-tRNA(Asn)/Glu-tRNA(Gln) amidotransferase subunit GatC [Candidatus Omnitrophota bacterium]